ncbi:flavin-containing monooxygenase [Nevskia soli]|uniref:flavin-containing monooxygenase n=1 Tax=Nevskia soli TaxID=418856 RepID=UPI0004A707F4|nr:NAD(P)/FAD-dependent oxidoreductase [Nevskia soli]
MNQNFDVLIIGAGLSGIGAACHLAMECPGKRVAILERRNAIGGTWDLFRYPGIRSDSDMFSFGFKFRPWNELKVLADGPSIRQYVSDTARQYGIDKQIQFGLKTIAADWSSEQQCWTVTALHEASGETRTYRANFLIGATGYYNYDQGFLPHFPGEERFKGLRIHPQHWPENLDYRGKRVVVIGSGATAVTLVPAMADAAAHVTMLQRSPSYIFSVPGFDKISAVLRHVLPEKWVYGMARKRNIVIQRWLYLAARRWPERVRKILLAGVRKQLDDKSNMRHFTPSYMPWDERLCAVPDADLFKAINSGKASVVTDHIESFTETGIQLKSGQTLEADIIITATGLQIQVLGGTELRVDQQPRPVSAAMTYKGVLMQDIPNMAWIVGYTNAPWTLKADIASHYICRLLNHMDAKGLAVATPHTSERSLENETIFGSLGSGYVRRASHLLPRQGRDLPWRVLHHYERDTEMLMNQPIDDGVLEFTPARTVSPKDAVALAA